jgi:hypothetical protein
VNPEGELTILSLLTGKEVERALTGNSPYMINAGIYYDSEKTKTSYGIQYNIFGPRIIIPPVIVAIPTGVGDETREIFAPGLYQNPRHALDITIRQKIFSFLGLKLGVQNVLNQPVEIFMDRDQDEKFTKGNKNNPSTTDDVIRTGFEPGRYWTFGLSFIF